MDSNCSNPSNNGDDVVLRRSVTPTTIVAPHVQLHSRASPKNATPTTVVAPRKIMGRNQNNTTFPTSFPSNLAELQLFRVMQNASLLFYYDTLLEMGGDDVQQLCDAGEEEFLEIMSLVGMASKPLHVRRFQKSLHEWVSNPCKFKTPLTPSDDFELEQRSVFEETARMLYASSPASPISTGNKRPYSPMVMDAPSSSSSPGSSTQQALVSTPVLQDAQIAKLAAAAERLSKELPQFEPKQPNNKKKMCKELEIIIKMPDTDPRRMDEIRRYAAIYGRFDCKRRPEKPLTLHEVSVNEAAAQICCFIPALLTRRDDLFTFARQVVKNAGCNFAKTGIGYSSMCNVRLSDNLPDALVNSSNSVRSNLMRSSRLAGMDEEGPSAKRLRNDSQSGSSGTEQQQDDAESGHQELFKRFENNSNSFLLHDTRRMCSIDTDDDQDERFTALSDASSSIKDLEELNDKLDNSPIESPCEVRIHDAIEELTKRELENAEKLSPKVQVVAACGANIIAVTNPALSHNGEHLTEMNYE